MKFLVTKESAPSALLRSLMISVVFAIILYIFLDIVLHSYLLGSDIQTIQANIFGDEENFIEPLLIETLLLQIHIDLFMTLFGLMILTSIYIRFHNKQNFTKWFVHIVLFLGLISPIILLLAFFTIEIFIYIWLISFILWHILALIMGIITLKKLFEK